MPKQVTKLVDYEPGPVGRALLHCYDECSTDPLPEVLAGMPPQLLPWLTQLFPKGLPKLVEPLVLDLALPDSGTALVGYSGGKDSTAAALKMKREGLDVQLLHIKGLNRGYPHEYRCSVEMAEQLGMPMHVIGIRSKGRGDYMENPVRNQLIMGLMLDFALQDGRGWAVHVLGGLQVDRMAGLEYGGGWSDTVEMFAAAATSFAALAPGYIYRTGVLRGDTDSLLTIVEDAAHTIPYLRFCMLPAYRRPSARNANIRKWGEDVVLPNRCGSCYKCCIEYLQLATLGLLRKDAGFGLHCAAKVQRAMTTLVHPGAKYTVEESLAMRIEFDLVDVRPLAGLA